MFLFLQNLDFKLIAFLTRKKSSLPKVEMNFFNSKKLFFHLFNQGHKLSKDANEPKERKRERKRKNKIKNKIKKEKREVIKV